MRKGLFVLSALLLACGASPSNQKEPLEKIPEPSAACGYPIGCYCADQGEGNLGIWINGNGQPSEMDGQTINCSPVEKGHTYPPKQQDCLQTK